MSKYQVGDTVVIKATVKRNNLYNDTLEVEHNSAVFFTGVSDVIRHYPRPPQVGEQVTLKAIGQPGEIIAVFDKYYWVKWGGDRVTTCVISDFELQ